MRSLSGYSYVITDAPGSPRCWKIPTILRDLRVDYNLTRGCRELQIASVKRMDLRVKLFETTRVIHQIISRRPSLGGRHLRGENAAHFGLRKPAARPHAHEPQLVGAVDHEHTVDATSIVGRLDQQRHYMHHIRSRRRGDAPLRLLADQRT